MSKIATRFIVCIFFTFYGCESNIHRVNKKIIKEWIGKEIILPELYDNSNQNAFSGGLKVVAKINGNCYSCLMDLKKWKTFMENIPHKGKISFCFYLVISDSAVYKNLNKKEIHFDHPVIYDEDNKFQKQNKLNSNSIFHVMLLDSSNRVLLIGDPINNKKMTFLYKKVISQTF
jgi:hypothetical protein